MKTITKYRSFERDRSVDEQLHDAKLWMLDLEFLELEIPFFKRIIQSFPFKIRIPDLFERIQLFVKELDLLAKRKTNITEKIDQHMNLLNGMLECNDLDCDNFYIVEQEKLAEEVFNFKRDYKKLKTRIFEFISGIIN